MLDALLHEIARLGLEQETIIDTLVRSRIAIRKDLQTSIVEIRNRAEEFKKEVGIENIVQDLASKGMRRSRTKPFRIKKR